MNNMAKQMDMFDDGGLMDEGGTVDPVSGNDVPPGSTQEEVRDDIPAQLSEGEFVFPADVVRFIGLEKLMKIRQRAKAGLQRMDDMGQMGNSEEAIMPDDLPFSIDDLDMEDDGLEMAQGGVVQAANGTFVQPTPTTPNAGVFYNPASQPTTGVAAAPMQAASASAAPNIGQAATPVQAASAGQPTMFTNYQLPQAPVPVMTPPAQLPKFLGEVAPGVGGIDYVEEIYVNESGQTIKFRRYNDGTLKDAQGNIAVIPEGYTIKTEADKKVTTDPTKVKTATVQEDGDGGDFDPSTPSTVTFGGEIAKTGRNKGLVQGAFRAGLSFTGIGLSDIRGMMGAGFSSLAESISGGKMGQPLSLSGNQGAILSNIIDPTTKRGVSPASALGFNLTLNAEQYNKYITRSGPVKTTDRQELASIVRELAKIDDVLQGETLSMERAGYLAESIKMGREDDIRDSIEKSKDFEKSLSDALGRDRGKVSGSGIFGTNIGGEDRTGAISAEERAAMTDSEKAAADKAVADYVSSMMGGQPADDDEENEPGGGDNESSSSSSSSSDAGGFSGSSGSYGGYDDFMNKGGLVSQMKRSGLASKK